MPTPVWYRTPCVHGQLLQLTITVCWAESKPTWCLWNEMIQRNCMGVPKKVKKTQKEGPAVMERFDMKQVNQISSIHSTMTGWQAWSWQTRCHRIVQSVHVGHWSLRSTSVVQFEQAPTTYVVKALCLHFGSVCLVNAGQGHTSLTTYSSEVWSHKICTSILWGLLAAYKRPVTRVGGKMLQPPRGWLIERHFLANITITTFSGKPSLPDYTVCSDLRFRFRKW